MNLLTDPLLSVTGSGGDGSYSLPGLLAAMSRGEVSGFPALRAHQRAPWHMFLVQLSVLTLAAARRDHLPLDEETWAALLRGLTPEHPHDAPWRLVVEDGAKPAFMQPPVVEGLNWSKVSTPDRLDLLITARNHDLKAQVARDAAAEDWVLALVSIQTMEGYGGAGNHGIARMNGGSSSRALLGLAPAGDRVMALDPSAWWRRDVTRLLHARSEGQGEGVGVIGGLALLWCEDWPEGVSLDVAALDPLNIEVCRRVRLLHADGRMSALRATSKAGRIDAKALKGALGDPWAPVHKAENKALTLAEGDFSYRRLVALLLSGEWKVPFLAQLGPDEAAGDHVLVAEALSRGNSKTDGLKSRVVPVPRRVIRLFQTPDAAAFAEEQMLEVAHYDKALRNAVALYAARGVQEDVDKDHYARATEARRRLDAAADRLFFPALWARLGAEDAAARRVATLGFRAEMLDAAKAELNAALQTTLTAAVFRARAEERARRAFWGALRKAEMLEEKEIIVAG